MVELCADPQRKEKEAIRPAAGSVETLLPSTLLPLCPLSIAYLDVACASNTKIYTNTAIYIYRYRFLILNSFETIFSFLSPERQSTADRC